MKTDFKSIDTLLSALGVRLPLELLARLDIEEYLDQLDHVVAFAAGERQRLGTLLLAAGHISPGELDDALAEQRRAGLKLGEVLIARGVLTQRERDVVLEFQRRQACSAPASREFALGNILVANGQITRAQLEDALRRQIDTGRRLGEELIKAGHASKGLVDRGLLLQQKLISCALAVTVGLAPLAAFVPAAHAGQASASMLVSVRVVADAKMRVNFQATQISVTKTDVARGYVEVAAASRYSVNGIDPSGYLLVFHPVGKLFESAQVGGLGSVVELGADGGTVVQRGPLPANLTQELSFRFVLRPGLLPGSYPWPLRLSVRALS